MAHKHAPATARNAQPIGDVLASELPASGTVLEIASGTGEHAVAFAARFPSVTWQPSDPDEEAIASISAYRKDADLENLRAPMQLDASSADWPVSQADALVCINMVHISPWAASEGLFAGAGRLLGTDAPLILYGPYLEADVPTAPSNLDFDASLKARNPAWGLRDAADVDALAASQGFTRSARHAMPANNIMLVYRHS